jgi:putative chitinase
LDQNIELRIRFADYFSHVATDRYRKQWQEYLSSLNSNREKIRAKIDHDEHEWQVGSHQPSINQVELDRLQRELHWNYAEVGYSEPNRNLIYDPHDSKNLETQVLPDALGYTSDSGTPVNNFRLDIDKFIVAIGKTVIKNITESQIDGIKMIVNYWDKQYSSSDKRMLAYIIGTAMYETNNSMQPIEEIGKGGGSPYGRPDPVSGKVYYGRGLIGLTWKNNYQKVGNIIGMDLVGSPELALDPQIGTAILVKSMMIGLFTGKKLQDYFHDQFEDWINARRVIGGLQGAELIAANSQKIFVAMQESMSK